MRRRLALAPLDRYVFAVIQNGFPVAAWPARKAQDRFATALASTL